MAARRLQVYERCMLSTMADYAGRQMEKSTLAELLELANRTPEERATHMHETLKVGLSRCALRLGEMPFGMCNAPSIKRVSGSYVQDFRKVLQYERHFGHKGFATQDYHEITKGIFNAQKGTMLDIAKGVFEYNEDLAAVFGKNLELAEVRKDVPAVRGVEDSLDKFFTERLTMRLLISHTHNLATPQDEKTKKDSMMVGVVNTNTQPIIILSRAFTAVRFMCKRDFNMSPDLEVNGVKHDEYILTEKAKQHFPYVHTHLFYIFLELLKNAARASVIRGQADHEEAGLPGKPKLAPIQVFLP